jgi:hypothetical protein
MDDPIVEEVHRIREEIMKEFNYDLEAYLRYLKEREEEDRKNGRVIVSPPPRRTVPTKEKLRQS